MKRSARRRTERQNSGVRASGFPLRTFVLLLPLACVVSLALRVEGRAANWSEDIHGPDRDALLMHDWSLRRAEIEEWLNQHSAPQLVFVRYSPRHNVNFEWVFNRADLVDSHMIWARDLGTSHDGVLLKQFPTRTAWVIDADNPEPQLVPYAQAGTSNGFTPNTPQARPEVPPA